MVTAGPATAPPLQLPPSGGVPLTLANLTVADYPAWHRITDAAFPADSFNPNSNARFSPIRDASGKSVGVMYLATDWSTSVMETLFHSLSIDPAMRSFNTASLGSPIRIAAEIGLSRSVDVIDLTGLGLTAAGAGQALTRCFPVHYPWTRQWALALYDSNPDAHGIFWTSRQSDNGKCLMLFEDRCFAGGIAAAVHASPVRIDSREFLVNTLAPVARLAGIKLL